VKGDNDALFKLKGRGATVKPSYYFIQNSHCKNDHLLVPGWGREMCVGGVYQGIGGLSPPNVFFIRG